MSASFIKTVLFSVALTACTASPDDQDAQDSGVDRTVPTRPRDECTCDLDLGSMEDTGDYPNERGDDLTLIPGYGVYDANCEVPSLDSEEGIVDFSFDCDPQSSGGNPGSLTLVYYQQAWISVRKTFVNLQDFSCCNSIDFDFRSSGYSLICNCSDGSDASTECCFDTYGLVRRAKLRMTLVDVESAVIRSDPNEELWWYDFPEDTLDEPSEWRSASAPLRDFVLAEGAGTRYNNAEFDADFVSAIEINIAITLGTAGVAQCDSSGHCYSLDNYGSAHVAGDLSFRNMRTVCE